MAKMRGRKRREEAIRRLNRGSKKSKDKEC